MKDIKSRTSKARITCGKLRKVLGTTNISVNTKCKAFQDIGEVKCYCMGVKLAR